MSERERERKRERERGVGASTRSNYHYYNNQREIYLFESVNNVQINKFQKDYFNHWMTMETISSNVIDKERSIPD